MAIIESFPEPFIPPSSTVRMPMHFDVLPVGLVDYSIWLPRVRVGATEVLVREGPTVDDQDGSAGKTATFTLVDEMQKSLFTSSAQIDFGWGERDATGAWVDATMQWEILDGYKTNLADNKQGPPDNVQDAVTVTIASSRDQKLNATSAMGLTIYDPGRVELSAVQFKSIPSSDNQTFTREVDGVPGLTLADLFQRVFVTECGFDGYYTNLPVNDWPIERYDVDMGKRFFDGLKGHISVPYAMTVSDDGTTVYLWDITQPQPDGFPAPRQITVGDVQGISTNEEYADLDALRLLYMGLENNFDFQDILFDYPGDESTGETNVRIEDIYLRFWKIVSPGNAVEVNRILNIRNKTTEINGVTVEELSDNYEFGPNFQYSHRRKTTSSLLPDLPDATPVLKNSSEEREEYEYAAHPYKQRAIYRASATMVKEGLVTYDADNPNVYGDSAKQAYDVSLRSNNIAEGQTYNWETISRRRELYAPQRDGTVIRYQRITDNVVPSQPIERTERIAGDVSILTSANGVQEMIVLAADGDPRTLKRIDDFPVAELPLKYAIPLARRELRRRQTAGRQGTVPFIGYDPTLQKGVTVSLYDRDSNAIGNFIITGLSKTSNNTNGLIMTLTVREVIGSAEPLQRQPAYRTSVESASTWTGTLPIECTDGFFVAIDPGTISGSIEMRHVEVPAVAYTNLETNIYDLSPYAGLTEDFEFRFTAPTVMVPTAVDFDLVVAE